MSEESNIPKAHWEIRNDVLKELRCSLKEIVQAQPQLNSAFIDAEEFLENFYFDSAPKTLDISVLLECAEYVGFQIKTINGNHFIKGSVIFYGDGRWHYDFKVYDDLNNLNDKISTYGYEGLGYKMNIRNKPDESDFIFYISEELNKLLEVPEPYSKEYTPLYKIQKNCPKSYSQDVTWGWSEGYYDGPLSGYCYFAKKLCRFEMQEEKDYSRTRLYKILELTTMEQIRAKIKHWFWEHPIKFLPQPLKSKFFYKVVSPILVFDKDYFKNKPIIGYFES